MLVVLLAAFDGLYPTSLLLRVTSLPGVRLPIERDDDADSLGFAVTLKFGSLRLLNILKMDPRFGFFCDASLTLRVTGFDGFFLRCGNELNLRSNDRQK